MFFLLYMPVKPYHIKEIGKLLLDRYPDVFTTEFSRNKKMIDELTNIESKKVRNRIAGYVSKKVKENNNESEDSTEEIVVR